MIVISLEMSDEPYFNPTEEAYCLHIFQLKTNNALIHINITNNLYRLRHLYISTHHIFAYHKNF